MGRVTAYSQRLRSTFRKVVRSVRSGGGADTTTADEARRMEGARCCSSLPPLAERGRLGTAEASGGSSDSSDAVEPGQTGRRGHSRATNTTL